MMILASLAGCIGTDDLEVDDTPTESLGTVIASTYHVEQLASAVGGDLVTVEMMSTMNVPVHDYEPSASDLVRLSQADVFFYHGLGLEPWVEGALANMDGDGPVAVETHSMPTGETTLDYESMLIENLCASLTDPATTDVHILAEHAEDAEELHSDDAGHNMAFPEDDHDEDHHDEDGHDEDDHDEDGHDEDDHEKTATTRTMSHDDEMATMKMATMRTITTKTATTSTITVMKVRSWPRKPSKTLLVAPQAP